MRHNQRPIDGTLSQTPATDVPTRIMWRGYEDVRLGLPIPPAFEKWDQPVQMNYEAGRRSAAALVRHMPSCILPPWPENMEFTAILPAQVSQEAVDDFMAEQLLTTRGKPVT